MDFIAQISQESLTKWKDIATIIGVVIAIATVILGLITLKRYYRIPETRISKTVRAIYRDKKVVL